MIFAALQSTRFVTSTTARPVNESSLKADNDPHLAEGGDANRQREVRIGARADLDGAIGLRRDQRHQVLHRKVGARQLQRPAIGIVQVKAGRFQPAVLLSRLTQSLRRRAKTCTKPSARYHASKTTTPKGTLCPIASSTRSIASAILVRNCSCRTRNSGFWSNTGSTCLGTRFRAFSPSGASHH